MSAKQDTISRTIIVALLLCIVCSVVVSAAAVLLKPQQIANKELDRKSNILAAAGLKKEGESVEAAFKQITPKVVDLKTGKFTDAVDVATYDAQKAAKDPAQSNLLDKATDIASIRRTAKYKTVYLVKEGDKVKTLILPVHGYGLWSTMYGYLALDGDLNTVKGLSFYAHGETPGLGGEVDNPAWKASWQGKKIYKDTEEPEIALVKGKVDNSAAGAEYKIDGLSGATLTSNGVTNLMKFWMGENGYAPLIKNLKAGGA